MIIVELTGDALKALLENLQDAAAEPFAIHTLRLGYDHDGAKYKLNEWTWSPPFPPSNFNCTGSLVEEHEGAFWE